MKRGKIYLVLVLSLLLMIITSCVKDDHTHKYDKWIIDVNPTETVVGQAHRTCDCGEIDKTQVPVLTDTSVWEKSIKEATCSSEGSINYTSVYGTVVIVVEKLEHNYGEWQIVVEPTETTKGKAQKECVCQAVVEQELPVLTDTSVWTKTEEAATCTKEGKITYSSIYGDIVKTISKLEHNYKNYQVVTAPTLIEEGLARGVCDCSATDEVVLPKLTDDTFWTIIDETAPTCQTVGSRTYRSQYVDVTIELEKLEHNYKWTITTAPTLTEKGSAEGVCDCEDTTEVDLEVLTDSDVWEITEETAPTYNEKGSVVYHSIYGDVTLETAKKVAPYDNKTYSSFSYDVDDDEGGYKNGVISVETAWNQITITLDEFGKGIGTAYPFRGYVEIKMLDEETGKIEIKLTKIVEESGEDGKPVLDSNEVSIYYGYVDFESGIIVSAYSTTFDQIHVWTPFEVGVTDASSKASSWDNSIAITYTYDATAYNIFVYKDRVYYGVSFVDLMGSDVNAEACYNNDYVYVKDQDGNVLFGFVYNGTKLVLTDGLEGTYTSTDDELIISGYGTLTYNGMSGTYELLESETNKIGVYVDNKYYEVTLTEDTFVADLPFVNITFDTGDKAVVEDLLVNKNIVCILPTPTNELFTFKGWFYDEDCTKPVEAEFIPTSDVVLYALWKEKVVVNLVGVLDGDPDVLYLGVGDIIGEQLPKYGIQEDILKVFRGWYLDAEYSNSLPEEAAITKEDNNVTIYAKWEDLPVYYGEYLGTEVWSSTYGNSASVTIKIDENGKITGKFTGTVENYDQATQKITWKNSSGVVKYLWFDETTGVIATHYSSQQEIGTDFYILSKYQTTNKVAQHYGIKAPKEPGSSTIGYYAHFINIMTKDGAKEIFIYNNYIYSDFVATDTAGNSLTAENVRNSKTVVVKNLEGNIIIALTSLGASFNENNDTTTLDEYYGTYTNEDQTIVLDGTGIIVFGEKTGTYTKASEGADYGFDVYLSEKTEYYQLTLDGTSFTMVKPMATISFNVGEDHTPINSIEVNINVVATLPSGEDDGYVFNGWFLDAEFNNAVGDSFIPTENITLYAKYSLPAVLTIVYNNDSENTVIIYSQNDIVIVERPVYDKHAFVGWYTTSNFEEGTEWVSGTEILEDITIYAKWEDAPIYNNNYLLTEIGGNSANGGKSSTYTRTGAIAAIDPYGVSPKGSSWPFNNEMTIKNYNSETGTLEFYIGTTVYRGFIDPESKIIILNDTSGLETDIEEVWFLNPFENVSIASKIKSSYWNGGKTRAIEYTYDETTYSIFIHNNNVYFGVEFKDSLDNVVTADQCFGSTTLYVYDSTGSLIIKAGYDDTTMVELDGYEGTYTNGDTSIVIDGVQTITQGELKGQYIVAEADSGYTLDVYLDGKYYEITLDTETKTYTINQPMVTITFDASDKAVVDELTTNKNIIVTLPTPTNENYIFRGWYLDTNYETEVDLEYLPTESLTLYAKWDLLVTLTIVYGNTLEDLLIPYGVGDLVVPVEPAFTNGKVFEGWYLDQDFQNPYTPGVINEDTTIYCKWIDSIALFGNYVGFEIYGGSSNDSTSSGGYQRTLTVDALGNVSGERTGVIEDYDPETGFFKLVSGTTYRYGYYDATNGVLIYNYSSGKEELGNDYFIFFKGYDTATSGSNYSSYWLSGYARLTKAVINTNQEILVFVYNNNVHINVTYTSPSNPEPFGPQEAYKQQDINIYDENNNLIYEFIKQSSKLVLKVLDGYQGTYTIGSDTLVLDGYGKGTLNGESITYSFKDLLFIVVGDNQTNYYEYNEETKEFSVKTLDALANKTASKVITCPNDDWGMDQHTIKYSFDGVGNVTISFSCDGWGSYCFGKMTGAATYTIEGDVLTITHSKGTITFTLDNATNPTKLTCASTTLTSDDDDYFAVGTIINLQ